MRRLARPKPRALLAVLSFLAACTGTREGSSAPADSALHDETAAERASTPAKHPVDEDRALPSKDAAPEKSAAPAETIAAADRNPAPLRGPTEWEADDSETGKERDRTARSRRTKTVEKLFAAAGVHFPAS